MFDNARAFIHREAMELPGIFRVGQTDSRGAEGPGIGELGNENIGRIICFLGPQKIMLSFMLKMCMVQGKIRKCNIILDFSDNRTF